MRVDIPNDNEICLPMCERRTRNQFPTIQETLRALFGVFGGQIAALRVAIGNVTYKIKSISVRPRSCKQSSLKIGEPSLTLRLPYSRPKYCFGTASDYPPCRGIKAKGDRLGGDRLTSGP